LNLLIHRANFVANDVAKPIIVEGPETDQTRYHVVFPMIHPGRDKYDSQPPAFRRLLLLSWMLALALTQYAVSISQSHTQRKQLCEAVLQYYESIELRQIRDALEETKQELSMCGRHTREELE
jgi:hypothetical protein